MWAHGVEDVGVCVESDLRLQMRGVRQGTLWLIYSVDALTRLLNRWLGMSDRLSYFTAQKAPVFSTVLLHIARWQKESNAA